MLPSKQKGFPSPGLVIYHNIHRTANFHDVWINSYTAGEKLSVRHSVYVLHILAAHTYVTFHYVIAIVYALKDAA